MESLLKFHKVYYDHNNVTMDVYREGKIVCEITIPPEYRYLVIGHIDIGVDYKSGIMSSQIYADGGATIIGGGNNVISRSTSDSGGGCIISAIVNVTGTDGKIKLNTYRYIDVEYLAYGILYAIPISKI